MLKFRSTVLLLLLSLASGAFALDVQSFSPKSDRYEGLTVNGSTGLRPMEFQLGVFANFIKDPLELNTTAQNQQVARLVESMLTVDLLLAAGLTEWLSIDVILPFNLLSNLSEFTNLSDESQYTLGDLQAQFNFRLADNKKRALGVAFVPSISVPLNDDTQDFFNNESFTYSARLVFDRWFGKRNYLALNLGGRYRQDFSSESLEVAIPVEKEWLSSLAYVHALNEKRSSDLFLELHASTAFDDLFSTPTTPFEALAGFRKRFSNRWTWVIGGGTGLSNGYSSPEFRAFTGVIHKFGNLSDAKPKPAPIVPEVVEDERPAPVLEVTELTVRIEDEAGLPVEADIVAKRSDGKTVAAERQTMSLVRELRDGTYMLYARKTGYTSIKRKVTLTPGERLSIKMVLGKIKKKGEKIEYLDKIFFDFNKATIREESYIVLDKVIDILTRHEEISLIEVQAHTDSKGSQKYNQNLSEARAESVMNYLISRNINPKRLSYKGYGESRPIAENQTDEGRARNRRVEFQVLETTGETSVRDEKEFAPLEEF